MGSKFDNRNIKTTENTRGGNRKYVPVPLDKKKKGTPTIPELIEEAKLIIGMIFSSLKMSKDIYKASNAVGQLVKSIAQISGLEKAEELAEELTSKSPEELKEAIFKELDKIK